MTKQLTKKAVNNFFNAISTNDCQKIQNSINKGFNIEKSYNFKEKYEYEQDGIKHKAACENFSSPIVWAAIRQKSDALETLLNTGVNADSPYERSTALLEASRYGYLESAEVLIKHNANINALDPNHNSSLMRAAWHGEIEAVKFLLNQQGLDVAAKNNDDKTALDLAFERMEKHKSDPETKKVYSDIVDLLSSNDNGQAFIINENKDSCMQAGDVEHKDISFNV